MRKLLYVSIILLLLTSVIAIGDTVPLYAGKNLEIGTVTVAEVGTNLEVTYTASGGWEMTATHLDVKTSLEGIPQSNGNPVPGQFTYKTNHIPPVTTYTYIIPKTWSSGTKLYIAAHADVVDYQAIYSSPLYYKYTGI